MPVSINGNGTITGLVITTTDLADSSVTTAKIADSNVTGAKLENSGATAGTYTYSTVTVDAKGRVTSASSGSSPAPPTTLYAIGTYVLGRPANSTAYAVNSTIAGTSLYATTTIGQYRTAGCCVGWAVQSGQTLVNTGTWRCMAPAYATSGQGYIGLWVRIS